VAGRTALALTLHERFGRFDVFALFGIRFSQRNRTQIQGLSPRFPDGGYCIFITIDKSELDEAYDYEDQLYFDSFEWVTRRGVGEDHPDYVNLRQPNTRVSLFVRHGSRDRFAYLGEMTHEAHREFNAENGQKQQRYVFRLEHEVPSQLLAELTGETGHSPARARVTHPAREASAHRRPATLNDTRSALAYVLGDLHRVMVPAHHNFQIRLKGFLERHRIEAEWERDFVDVRFSRGGHTFIGEIKVTSHFLKRDEAFRVALGQLLFYGHLRFEQLPGLVMFFDFEPAKTRIELASRLGIAVVFERAAGEFELLNAEVAPGLAVVFPLTTTALA
jgi:hypothetical protein